MDTNRIKSIEITGLFEKYNVKWTLHPDVNILVGINGIGKTTIL
ncbi:MAG: ATP-binding protein, partial [Candidatus Symbiothrix sp.]|nr:ATP-binding protein [Candidatus Symbiothrix sp.]